MSHDAASWGARLRELARVELDELRHRLAQARGGRDRAVHKARKALQRLRALVRFLGPVDDALARRENVRLRQLRRRLAPLRDAASRSETLRLLATRAPWREHADALRQLAGIESRRHAQVWATHPPEAAFWDRIDQARRELEARVPTWPFEQVDAAAIATVLSKARRQLRRYTAAARGECGRELRHELRRKLRRDANLRHAAAQARGDGEAATERLLAAAKRCGHEGDLWLALLSVRRAAREQPQWRGLASALEHERRRSCARHDRLLRSLLRGETDRRDA